MLYDKMNTIENIGTGNNKIIRINNYSKRYEYKINWNNEKYK